MNHAEKAAMQRVKSYYYATFFGPLVVTNAAGYTMVIRGGLEMRWVLAIVYMQFVLCPMIGWSMAVGNGEETK